MPLADPRTSPLAALAAADFQQALADAGVEAMYRPLGQGAGRQVRALVSIDRRRAIRIPTPGVNPGQTALRAVYMLQVPAVAVGEAVSQPATGVGDAGGVVELKVGDTLTVPGIAADQPQRAEVTLRVGPGPRMTESAYWVGEAFP